MTPFDAEQVARDAVCRAAEEASEVQAQARRQAPAQRGRRYRTRAGGMAEFPDRPMGPTTRPATMAASRTMVRIGHGPPLRDKYVHEVATPSWSDHRTDD